MTRFYSLYREGSLSTIRHVVDQVRSDVSIRFIAKGLCQRDESANGWAAHIRFYSLYREGSLSTQACGMLQPRGLRFYSLYREESLSTSSSGKPVGRCDVPVSIRFIAKGLCQPALRRRRLGRRRRVSIRFIAKGLCQLVAHVSNYGTVRKVSIRFIAKGLCQQHPTSDRRRMS